MSWSVSAIGKPAAVAAKVKEDLAGYKCVDPEEDVKHAAGAVILHALKAQAPDTAVRVNASGHQGTMYGPDGKSTGIHNTLRIEVEPIHGFVE
jgi:hypothetical protein